MEFCYSFTVSVFWSSHTFTRSHTQTQFFSMHLWFFVLSFNNTLTYFEAWKSCVCWFTTQIWSAINHSNQRTFKQFYVGSTLTAWWTLCAQHFDQVVLCNDWPNDLWRTCSTLRHHTHKSNPYAFKLLFEFFLAVFVDFFFSLFQDNKLLSPVIDMSKHFPHIQLNNDDKKRK